MNQLIQNVQPAPLGRENQQSQANAGQDGALNLAKYFSFISDNRGLIAGIALAITFIGIAYALLAKPVYEANILIQVKENGGSSTNILGNLSRATESKTAVAAEMEILRSRMVLSHAAEKAHLGIDIGPKYFPGAGALVARFNSGLSSPGLFGYGGYAWGTERAEVSIFNVPEVLEGTVFTVTAQGEGKYRLSQEDESVKVTGRLGETLRFQAGQHPVELRIDHIEGKPGVQFLLAREPRIITIEKLQRALTIREKGKQSGIITVTLEGPDPQRTSALLREIGAQYVRQNEALQSEEAEKSLVFLNRQMPLLKEELERAESDFSALRSTRGTIDIGEEARTILEQSTSTQTRLLEMKQKKAELLSRFQDQHPAVEAINLQIAALRAEQDRVSARIKTLPAVEQNVVRASRNVKINTELYTALLSTAQQLRLVSESKVGNVRLLDMPVMPVDPVKPRRFLVVMLAAAIGLILGLVVALVKKSLTGRVDDPREIEQLLGLPVAATIPHSAGQARLHGHSLSADKAFSILSHTAPSDGAIESLRRLRSSLLFTMLDTRNNIIMVTGPTPGVGKSFISANFAAVLASIGKKVLLIDADLRTGHLHRYFSLDRQNGLSDALAAETFPEKWIHRDVAEHVDFISTGTLPERPAELLAHPRFGTLLRLLSTRYDFVLIDTAPVLMVSDALIVGPHAGACINIVRSGTSTVGEIEETVTRLNQAGVGVTGTVFNDFKSRVARYGFGSKYEKYRYADSV